MNSRAHAAVALEKIISEGHNLDHALSTIQDDKGFIQELCYGVCRYYFQLDFMARQLLQKPLKEKDFLVQALVLIGLYQLTYLDTENYAAVNECVAATEQLNKAWAKGLVNAILRNFLRKKATLLTTAEQNIAAHYAHPQWLIDMLQQDYPSHWQAILTENNQHPPMTLRVNQQHCSREHYLQLLTAENIAAVPGIFSNDAITLLKPIDVFKLPLFTKGAVSVQDEAAQLAAHLLELRPNQRVLDACAAPGGKTCHLLECEPTLQLTTLDNHAQRSSRITENLQRLSLSAKVIVADAAHPENWWNGQCFDRILLDAPCSATGVIRRHPDIKLLRRKSDIAILPQTQLALLNALWPLLNVQGILLYATCSLLTSENDAVIQQFLSAHADAEVHTITTQWGNETSYGRQLFPGASDGFYYARLMKQ